MEDNVFVFGPRDFVRVFDEDAEVELVDTAEGVLLSVDDWTALIIGETADSLNLIFG